MAARAPEDGLIRQTSDQDSAIPEDNESENPPEEEEKKKWEVQSYWGFSLEGIFGLALKFFKGNLFLLEGEQTSPVSCKLCD